MRRPSINDWILAARPKTLWAAVAPVVVGTAIAFDRGVVVWTIALVALVTALLIQIVTNFANDYFDYKKGADSGDRIGPVRATQAGLISPKAMKSATAAALCLTCFAEGYLVYRGGWPILLLGILANLSAILYTAGPFALGYLGLGDIFVLVFFGPVAVGGTYYVQALSIDAIPILAGLGPGLLSMAILTVNNLRDIESDRRAGKKTLAVRFGEKFARAQYLFAVVTGSAIPLLLYFGIRGHGHPWSALTIALPLFGLPLLQEVLTTKDGPALNEALASTGKLLLCYSLVFSVGWVL